MSPPDRDRTPDAVLFDLDGTLCERTQDFAAVYDRAFERAGVDRFGDPAALWGAVRGPPDPDPDEHVRQLAAGFARLAAQHGRRVDTAALAEALIAGLDHSQVAYTEDAERVLERAREHGPVGILTNGPARRQEPKVRALGLADVDPLVYAGDMPRRKPHADPFERALETLGVPADRTLYVGDSLAYDVAGAHAAGLQAAWLDDGDGPGRYRPEYVLDSLSDLLAVLG